jgi:protoheme IX farnesyltransferase
VGALAAVFNDYLTLTKPPIVVLLLITAAGGMFLAARGLPPLGVMALVWAGGAMAAGGANAINHYMDRDIDEQMNRTRSRPVADRRISPNRALVFGIVLNVIAFAVLAAWVNLLSALLTLSATLFYVLVYTRWLKRTTPQNIVIGGAAGSIPPLVGWAAVTGGLGLPALYLFAIIFFWTPPHFWALALLMKEDYARAGVPMLPVVKGVESTKRSILAYTVVVVALTILFFFTTEAGLIYLPAALVLGAVFLFLAWRLAFPAYRPAHALTQGGDRTVGTRSERRLYLYSLAYLALLFAAIMVDSAVGL